MTDLTISRLIPASPTRLWQAWSRPEQLVRWWIPAPMEMRVETLDLRPGGGFVTRMREPGGAWQSHIDGCFLRAEPERAITFTTCLTGGYRPAAPWLAITAEMTFTPEGGGTRYNARALHASAEDAAKHEEMGFQQGWGQVLDQLAALLA